MKVVIVRESDGKPTLDVQVGSTLIGTIPYSLGSSQRDPETVDLGSVTLNPGDLITLVGTLDAGAAARVDKIIIEP